MNTQQKDNTQDSSTTQIHPHLPHHQSISSIHFLNQSNSNNSNNSNNSQSNVVVSNHHHHHHHNHHHQSNSNTNDLVSVDQSNQNIPQQQQQRRPSVIDIKSVNVEEVIQNTASTNTTINNDNNKDNTIVEEIIESSNEISSSSSSSNNSITTIQNPSSLITNYTNNDSNNNTITSTIANSDISPSSSSSSELDEDIDMDLMDMDDTSIQSNDDDIDIITNTPNTTNTTTTPITATTSTTTTTTSTSNSQPTSFLNFKITKLNSNLESNIIENKNTIIKNDKLVENKPIAPICPMTITETLSTIKSKRITKYNSKKPISKSSIQQLPISKRFRSRSLPNIYFHSDMVIIKNKKQNSNNNSNNSTNPLKRKHHRHHHSHHHNNNNNLQSNISTTASSTSNFLPPVNLQSLHEIDLNEILKNPQLRHDILFDPQLQFRPNLDGERGKRKNIIADKYWNEVKIEISLLINENKNDFKYLPSMFFTLKEILLSLLPTKDKLQIEEVLDLNLIIQQLKFNCFNFINFSNWISSILKMHCAPMRDSWVDEMNEVFKINNNTITNDNDNDDNKSIIVVNTLIQGLRMLFAILEAMKLDVANHQIRILRPALCNTAISFEKDYFNGIILKNKINIQSSLNWFEKNHLKLNNLTTTTTTNSFDKTIIYSIINLLSCQSMYSEFPSSLIFDHSRLILLRADIRQLVCIKIVMILYKQMIQSSNSLNNSEKNHLLNFENQLIFKNEILSIIIDENGNSKWTRNLTNLSIQIVNKISNKKNLSTENNNNESKIDFCFNWLLKQTQPNSKIYSIIENQIFEKLINDIVIHSDINSIVVSNDKKITTTSTSSIDNFKKPENNNNNNNNNNEDVVKFEFESLLTRLQTLISFHWNVFDEIYIQYMNSKYTNEL